MSQPVEAFRNALRIPELKQRIIFTLIVLAVYRLGAHIPTPGVNGQALSTYFSKQGGGVFGFYDMFTGGALSQATIFALGIMPYISASIIMQLLTAVIPTLEKLQKEGPEGQKKINEYTRWGTVLLCVIQSIGIATWLRSIGSEMSTPILLVSGPMFYFFCILSFTTGSMFIMWLGEQISEHGVGNGISLLIFVSIIGDAPTAISMMFTMIGNDSISPLVALMLVALMVAVVAGVILVTTGQRRVPVQYPRQVKGRKMTAGGRTYLPLRVNQAGVIPIIFASALLTVPGMIANGITVPAVQDFVTDHMSYDSLLYNLMYALLIIFFSFFYTAITFNPVEMADNLKKNGAVVTGVRQGKATADYLNRVMTRITLVGSVFLALVALLPVFILNFFNIQSFLIAQFFGGTSLLILVGVALDTVRQIEQHLIMRNYEGFQKSGRIRGRRSF